MGPSGASGDLLPTVSSDKIAPAGIHSRILFEKQSTMSRSQPWIACTLECGAVCLFLFFSNFTRIAFPNLTASGDVGQRLAGAQRQKADQGVDTERSAYRRAEFASKGTSGHARLILLALGLDQRRFALCS